ncbi:MAG: DNRLRE domain-containing protein [Myxococcota bacterium]|nr:DNRLRE domain-containing protein [Myxococcota bacterium]
MSRGARRPHAGATWVARCACLTGVLVLGCGRLDYDPRSDVLVDSGISEIDDALLDASADAQPADGAVPEDVGAPPDDGGRVDDAGRDDAGADDAGASDAGSVDGGSLDAGGDTTVSLGAVADTALNSAATTYNYGTAASFNVRSDRISTYTGLMRFDLTGVVGSRILSAELHLTTSTVAISSGRVDVHRVLEAWQEGTQSAGAGTASWAERLPGTAWAAAGCGVGSRESAAVATFMPYAASTSYTVTLPIALVRSWADTPTSNHGLAIVAVDTSMGATVGFRAREFTADPPHLVLELAPP